jgi:putative transposase
MFGVEPICTVLSAHGIKIAPSTYYEARSRRPSKRALREAEIVALIQEARRHRFACRFGARKMWLHLRANGHDVARCTVERLMAQQGWAGALRGKGPRTTISAPADPRPADLVDRDFTATAPNRLWVADFTYVATWSGTVYVAFVFDVFSRRIVGWRAATQMTTELVLDTLEHALWSRRREGIEDLTGLIHHTDAGSQGEFNRSSQHLVTEVLNGSSTTGRRSGDPTEATFTWSSEVPAPCGGRVLGRDRQGFAAHRGCRRGRRGASGRPAVVPQRWRHGAVRLEVQTDRPLPVFR